MEANRMRDEARSLSLLVLLLVLAGCKEKPEGLTGAASAAASATPCTCSPGDPRCDCLMKARTNPATSAAVESNTKPRLDPAAAIDLCKKGESAACSAACDGGDLPSCVAFAESLLSGSDRNAKKGCEAPLRKACDGKVGRGCSALARCLSAVILADGRETYVKDKREKATLNEQACTLDDGLGCFGVAKNYEEGEGVEQDDTKAEALMKKALTLMSKECKGGDGKSCLSLAMLYSPDSASTRVQKSETKSKALYKQACDAGEELACNVLKADGK